MLTIQILREYLRLPPDTPDSVADMCLKAAKSKARSAGITDFQNNKQYDLFLCELAGLKYDNRGLSNFDEAAQRLINANVLELRYAEEDTTPETFKLTITAGANTTVAVTDSDGNEYADGADIDMGTVLIIAAAADEGYELSAFNVNDSAKTSPDVHTVTGAVTIETEATLTGGD
jgi:hypothetical protein